MISFHHNLCNHEVTNTMSVKSLVYWDYQLVHGFTGIINLFMGILGLSTCSWVYWDYQLVYGFTGIINLFMGLLGLSTCSWVYVYMFN